MLDAEPLDIRQQESGCILTTLSSQAMEVCALYVVQHKCWSHIFLHVTHLDVIHLQSLDVANEETIGRHFSEHDWLRVIVFLLGRVKCCLFFCPSTLIIDANIT